MRREPISLALGGGGARGIAHVGVLAEMEQSDLCVKRIVGVSMGSLIGAMYAFAPDAAEVEGKVLDYLLSDEFSRKQAHLDRIDASRRASGEVSSWYEQLVGLLQSSHLAMRAVRRPSFLPGHFLEDTIAHLVPDKDIADSKIPLIVAAVDLRRGRPVKLQSGPVRKAVCASASIPAIFPPIEWDGMLLSDLGVLTSLPVIAAKEAGTERVVAVDVGPDLSYLTQEMTSLQVLMRMIETSELLSRQPLRELADILITPDVGDIQWFDFSRSGFLIELGRQATRESLARSKITKVSWIDQLFSKFTSRSQTRVKLPPSSRSR